MLAKRFNKAVSVFQCWYNLEKVPTRLWRQLKPRGLGRAREAVFVQAVRPLWRTTVLRADTCQVPATMARVARLVPREALGGGVAPGATHAARLPTALEAGL